MHSEEQEEEIEVLKSIYDTRFTELSASPRRIRIDGIVGEGAGLELEVEFTPEYPHSLPPFTILVVSGRISDSEALRFHVKQEAERSLGMAMVFNMVSAIEDWLAKQKKNSSSTTFINKEAAPAVVDDFVLTMKGGPVTRESFLEWNAKFLAELQAKSSTAALSNSSNRLTGRQLFEQNRALATSDMNYADVNEAIVEVDVGAFEGLDDLDINDDDDIEDEISDDDSHVEKEAAILSS